ncbi:lytic transglycosylase domain-containing protein [Mycobacterium spongiae]|uniref:Transglycosylase SLT domain-containing protein n=1 Tax=Mycobacterium spongiae TaxID=886343 RepID=A0A975PZD5_9MYCO|nr:transglycosylase SLT domain-containing protein [Mycobacterium spongiae]
MPKADRTRPRYGVAHRTCVLRWATTVTAAITLGLVAFGGPSRLWTATTSGTVPSATWAVTLSPVATTYPARPMLAADPARLAADLSADEQALRNPSSSGAVLLAAARRQQVAYRAIGRHPEWDSIVRPRIPQPLRETYDRNVSARRHLTALSKADVQDTLPAWRIVPPTRGDALLGYYRKAEAATGVGWNYLAAINMVETGFGRIAGVSTAGAQGPMQFLPSTFAEYGAGGDIRSPHDAIMAAGRYLAANGFANDHDHAIFRYNNSSHYVAAVNDYAAVMASDPAALAGYYRWDIYYLTSSGDVLLPTGYVATHRIPVADYVATHPQ